MALIVCKTYRGLEGVGRIRDPRGLGCKRTCARQQLKEKGPGPGPRVIRLYAGSRSGVWRPKVSGPDKSSWSVAGSVSVGGVEKW